MIDPVEPSEPGGLGSIGRDPVGQAEVPRRAGSPRLFGSPLDQGTGRTPLPRASRRAARARTPPGARRCATVHGIVTACSSGLGRTRAPTREPRCGQSFGDGPAASRSARRGQMPGQDPVRRREVREVVVIHRPDDRQPVRPGRQHREVLADPDARRPRRDRRKAAADLRRRIGLRVPRVELAGPAPHEDEEARLRPPEPARPRRDRPVPIQLRQPQPGHRHRGQLLRLASRNRSPPELVATPPFPIPLRPSRRPWYSTVD